MPRRSAGRDSDRAQVYDGALTRGTPCRTTTMSSREGGGRICVTRFRIIDGTPSPDTPKERVRKRVRAARKLKGVPQCPKCGGRESVKTEIAGPPGTRPTVQDLCVACLLRGERRVIRFRK